MLWGGFAGELEVRRSGGATRLRGSFPYNKTATLSDGGRRGRPRKEKFVPGAFKFRVDDPKKEIHLLAGHDYGQPLASKLTDTLDLKDTAQALTFEARIRPEIAETSYGRDVLAQIAAGLAYGVSVGFRLPPSRAVKEVERIEEEPDDGSLDDNGDPRRGAIIRTVLSALLYELSIVTRPAYKESQIEARNWNPDTTITDPPEPSLHRALNRWRA
jgi:Escherichia/Staphylococcus phage prohead protease